jgi:hypothetical protein
MSAPPTPHPQGPVNYQDMEQGDDGPPIPTNVCNSKCLGLGIAVAVVLTLAILAALIYPFYIRPKQKSVSSHIIYG